MHKDLRVTIYVRFPAFSDIKAISFFADVAVYLSESRIFTSETRDYYGHACIPALIVPGS